MGRRQPHTTAQDRRSAKEAVEAGWQGQSHQSVRPLEAYCRIGRVVEAAVEGWAAGQPSRPRHPERGSTGSRSPEDCAVFDWPGAAVALEVGRRAGAGPAEAAAEEARAAEALHVVDLAECSRGRTSGAVV